jgi:uncharacterized protein
MTPDVNVLLAGSRSDHPHHEAAKNWLTVAGEAAARGGGLRLIPLVVASFLRLATNSRVFPEDAMPIEHAIAFVDALLNAPGVEIVAPPGTEWPTLRQLCLDKRLRGNALPDAWLAAVVGKLGEHLVTFDADFKKLLPRNQLTVLPMR